MTKTNRQTSVADALRATPGQWGKAGWYPAPDTAKTMASRIRTGRASAHWEPRGAFEAYWVKSGDEFVVYARYVGEDQALLDGGAR